MIIFKQHLEQLLVFFGCKGSIFYTRRKYNYTNKKIILFYIDFAPYKRIFIYKLIIPQKKYTAEIDSTDKRILKTLQQNAKLTTKELANEVNLSVTPVFERQKRLEKEGFIKKYVAVLDPEKIGLNM